MGRVEEQPRPPDEPQYSHWGWGWRLVPPVIEEQYRQDTRVSRNHLIRWWHGLGLVVNFFTLLLALWATPEHWLFTVLVYFGIVFPVIVVSRRVLVAPPSPRQELLASAMPVLVTYLASLTVFAISPAFDFSHAMSLLAMGIIWSGSPVPLRVPDTILVVGATLLLGGGINLIGALMHDAPFEHLQIVGFSLLMIALSLVARWASERRIRRTFMVGLSVRRRTEELEHSNETLKVLSNTDPLTGLYNRKFFDEHLQALWVDGAIRAVPIAVLVIDIDRFKEINDTYGHPHGDRCLVAVARIIEQNLRRNDFAARYGGDEFVAVMVTERSQAHASAERIRARIGELTIEAPGCSEPHGITASIGVAVMHPAASDSPPSALINAADAALFTAKRTGRNRMVVDGDPAEGTPAPDEAPRTAPA